MTPEVSLDVMGLVAAVASYMATPVSILVGAWFSVFVLYRGLQWFREAF